MFGIQAFGGNRAVTPFVGVWIEISYMIKLLLADIVTPFVGVWIEIYVGNVADYKRWVTPFVGVWIEMLFMSDICMPNACHSLRGSVD